MPFVLITKQNRTCDNIPYPNYPWLKMRNPCGAILIKTVCSYDGKKNYLYPEKVYAFQSLKNALSLLLCREDVVNALKKQGNLIRSDILSNITDGAFYQNFVDNNGVQYLKNYRNLAGLINVDC